jgi:hypothetical protein
MGGLKGRSKDTNVNMSERKGRMSLKEEVQDQSQARKGEEEVVNWFRGGGEKRGDQGPGPTRYM